MATSNSDHSAPQGWEDELNAAWALVNEARAERDRAIETRENANSVSVRVEAENERLAMAVKQWQGHATDAQEEADRLRAENEHQRERIASLLLYEPSKSAGLYAAIDELQRENEALKAERKRFAADVNQRLEWVVRDRREPDKVLVNASTVRSVLIRYLASDDSQQPEEGR